MVRGFLVLGLLCVVLTYSGGCATIRVTDPYQTATEQFLESEATRLAMQRVTANQLRDRKVYVDPSFLSEVRERSNLINYTQTPATNLYLLGELRAKLLLAGARLMDSKDQAEIIVEPRTGGIGVDRQDFLLGIPNITVTSTESGGVPVSTPEIAILKSTKQFGFASVAFVAYWKDTGEIVAASGPFVGRTRREDHWVVGFGPFTSGNIPPAEKAPPSDPQLQQQPQQQPAP